MGDPAEDHQGVCSAANGSRIPAQVGVADQLGRGVWDARTFSRWMASMGNRPGCSRRVPDVIVPEVGNGWLCDRLGDDVPQRFWNDTVPDDAWRHPHDWFDNTSFTGACSINGTTVVIGGSDVIPWGTNKTWLGTDDDPNIVDIDTVVDGIRVHGWAYEMPPDEHGNTWPTAALFAEGPDGRVAFLDLEGARHRETFDYLRLDGDVAMDFMVDLVRMR